MKRTLLILLILHLFSSKLVSKGIALSSSISGRYVVFSEIDKKGQVFIVDTKEQVLLDALKGEDFFIVWNNDSTFSYINQVNDSVNLYKYEIQFRKLELIATFENSTFYKAFDSKLFSMPKSLNNDSEVFIIFINENIIYKYFPFTDVIEELGYIKVPFEDFNINNISVDNTCSNLLMTLTKNGEGFVYRYNIHEKKYYLIEKGKEYGGDGTYIYFLKDETMCVYYKYLTNTEKKMVQVVLYKFNTNDYHVVDTIEDKVPTLLLDIPYKQQLYINYIDLSNPIEVNRSEQVINDLISGIIDRFNIHVVNY